jgi:hypothetical protein
VTSGAPRSDARARPAARVERFHGVHERCDRWPHFGIQYLCEGGADARAFDHFALPPGRVPEHLALALTGDEPPGMEAVEHLAIVV